MINALSENTSARHRRAESLSSRFYLPSTSVKRMRKPPNIPKRLGKESFRSSKQKKENPNSTPFKSSLKDSLNSNYSSKQILDRRRTPNERSQGSLSQGLHFHNSRTDEGVRLVDDDEDSFYSEAIADDGLIVIQKHLKKITGSRASSIKEQAPREKVDLEQRLLYDTLEHFNTRMKSSTHKRRKNYSFDAYNSLASHKHYMNFNSQIEEQSRSKIQHQSSVVEEKGRKFAPIHRELLAEIDGLKSHIARLRIAKKEASSTNQEIRDKIEEVSNSNQLQQQV